ncbi:hypothetical protein ARMSODRAFT_1024290 [Armillaria solidipes]|uniref:Uncharacterized protein n=1 Tax=Armillaria solidipes TaxID=1076256 RepID=A0A2H3BAA1_9AGAR|nr:hypothetical protein ARMSODRAFT_1024290 [Armillaria solidipes]
MTSQVSTAVPPSVGETLGVLYVGATIAAVLFGITNLQAVIYHKRYPNDWWLYRYSVALLCVLDTLHAVLSTHAVYFHLVDMFGNLAGALVHTIWSFKAQLGIDVGCPQLIQLKPYLFINVATFFAGSHSPIRSRVICHPAMETSVSLWLRNTTRLS